MVRILTRAVNKGKRVICTARSATRGRARAFANRPPQGGGHLQRTLLFARLGTVKRWWKRTGSKARARDGFRPSYNNTPFRTWADGTRRIVLHKHEPCWQNKGRRAFYTDVARNRRPGTVVVLHDTATLRNVRMRSNNVYGRSKTENQKLFLVSSVTHVPCFSDMLRVWKTRRHDTMSPLECARLRFSSKFVFKTTAGHRYYTFGTNDVFKNIETKRNPCNRFTFWRDDGRRDVQRPRVLYRLVFMT